MVNNHNQSKMNENNEQLTRYLKLVDLHRQLQNENSLLEERILSLVEIYSNEKNQYEQDLTNAKQRIVQLEETVKELEIDKQRYKDDCNLAVRLLHRNPKEFISISSEQLIKKNESTSTNQSQHSVIIPTFPPTYATSLPLFNTAVSLPPATDQTTTTSNDNLRLAESLFKSNTVHRYPSTHYICSHCHRTIKCCDVSVQTSLDDHTATSRTRVVSLTASDDGLSGISLESHNHAHMTVKEYQSGNTRRLSQEIDSLSTSIPQMHHV